MWRMQLALCADYYSAPTQTLCLPFLDTFQSVRCHLQSCSVQRVCAQFRWVAYCAIRSNNYATILPPLSTLPHFPFPFLSLPSSPHPSSPSLPLPFPSLPSSPLQPLCVFCVTLKTCTLSLFESKHSVAAMQAYSSSAHATEGASLGSATISLTALQQPGP